MIFIFVIYYVSYFRNYIFLYQYIYIYIYIYKILARYKILLARDKDLLTDTIYL